MKLSLTPLWITLTTLACAEPSDVTGEWGGDHVRFVGTRGGATITFDCAHTEILEPIRLDPEGRFVATGVYQNDTTGIHVHEMGDLPDDSVPLAYPGAYVGRITGNTMSLTVTQTNGTLLGMYTLERGVPGRLMPCR